MGALPSQFAAGEVPRNYPNSTTDAKLEVLPDENHQARGRDARNVAVNHQRAGARIGPRKRHKTRAVDQRGWTTCAGCLALCREPPVLYPDAIDEARHYL